MAADDLGHAFGKPAQLRPDRRGKLAQIEIVRVGGLVGARTQTGTDLLADESP
ncbi:hypothetical protein [Propionicicella superfundia]|uniref:hypothetical protein n=1 Tax=Propionicicella superfundia TaxID=348582 RepID=UPI0012EB338E|nr:hypothetical protein [Propionicicella superfundia]